MVGSFTKEVKSNYFDDVFFTVFISIVKYLDQLLCAAGTRKPLFRKLKSKICHECANVVHRKI